MLKNYGQVLASKRHRAAGKATGTTSCIERFNNTVRQRVGRLVRKALSFSKCLSNHNAGARKLRYCGNTPAG
ncbi:gsl1853 [Gloeobacter violaceus PCC 7421]|uniref:Gsl1853 protein n=1 Tax=Gloeobacter violaceus (strain ATCC 29082 / PCC 7421) TaxID=251221 RepID=Q7NJH9_GLOVI|nr:IS1 family transposase [Gloeobacter violaceus]BAC89794.1 gsl1853 [Gloeobacter violaceus PCC 7421]